MRRKANPLRIGLFALTGLALLVIAVVVVGGGAFFGRSERAVMHFNGSVYGLRVGAPVVFRGVRIGGVASIGIVHDTRNGHFEVPVVANINSALFREAQGQGDDRESALTLAALVQRGLRAQLLTQSLLTGQLYVDLDLDATRAVAAVSSGAPARSAKGAVEVPTSSASRQSLQSQLEGLDLRQIVNDVSAVAAAARQLATSPEARRSLQDLSQVAGNLARMTATLERRLGPLAEGVQSTLSETRRVASGLGGAADRIALAADRVGAAASRADALVAGDSALVLSIRQAATELARSAAALRQAAGDDSTLMQNVDGSLQELRRTSRAVRDLVELLERHPDALLRGRPASP